METIPLSQIEAGQAAVVEEVRGHGIVPQRLLEMGIIRGTLVEVIRFAPMGDPIDIRIKGYHLSLRREEASHIRVSVRK